MGKNIKWTKRMLWTWWIFGSSVTYWKAKPIKVSQKYVLLGDIWKYIQNSSCVGLKWKALSPQLVKISKISNNSQNAYDQYQMHKTTGCLNVKGASVNRAILQLCYFWFSNTEADVAIAILLPTLKHFSFNGALEWRTKCFCCERVFQKR